MEVKHSIFRVIVYILTNTSYWYRLFILGDYTVWQAAVQEGSINKEHIAASIDAEFSGHVP